jgi:hypothetical protein
MKKMLAVVVAVTVFFIMFCLGERMYIENSDRYPAWLTTSELEDVDNEKLFRIRETVCKREPIEIFIKRNHVILRCGWTWFNPTYIAKSYKGASLN